MIILIINLCVIAAADVDNNDFMINEEIGDSSELSIENMEENNIESNIYSNSLSNDLKTDDSCESEGVDSILLGDFSACESEGVDSILLGDFSACESEGVDSILLGYSTDGDSSLLGDSNKIDSNMIVKDTLIVKTNYLITYLKDSEGNAIAGAHFVFTVNDKNYSRTTDNDGKASLKINLYQNTYTINLNYAGDETYNGCFKSVKITVKDRLATTLRVANSTVIKGNYLIASLKDEIGNPVIGEKVIFNVLNKNYSRTTDDNGNVFLKINLSPKTTTVLISFSGTSYYSPINKSVNLKVVSSSFTVKNLTVIKGNSLEIYLKNHESKAIVGETVIFNLNNKNYTRTTDANGKASLKINLAPKKYAFNLIYEGNDAYNAVNKSITITVKSSSQFIVSNPNLLRHTKLNVYLKDGDNKALSGKTVTFVFLGKNYVKTTSSSGLVTLIINNPIASYTMKLVFAGDGTYEACTKSFTLSVVKTLPSTNSSSGSTVNTNSTISGNHSGVNLSSISNTLSINSSGFASYSVKLTDSNGNAVSGENLTFTISSLNYCNGSGEKISKKTILLDSDNIYTSSKDLKLLNDIGTILKSKGYDVIINTNIGPNAHATDAINNSNVCLFCIFGGVDSGMFVDMSAKWYQFYLNNNSNDLVLGFLAPPNTRDLATEDWLERSHDDDYSSESFIGLSYPGAYINQKVNADYVYGKNATQLANNFLNYAVKGLSIGLNNTIPKNLTTSQKTTTNSNGIAKISNLSAGYYKIVTSYVNSSGNYVNMTSYVTVS